MPDTCVTLPEYPDSGEPCINGTDIALVARCVNGLRVLMWVSVEEFGSVIDASAARTGAAPCGGSAVSKLLDLAREGKWTAKDTIKALQELPK